MVRVKRGVTASARHKRVLKLSKGFRGRAKSCYRVAIQRLHRSWSYAYRDRKVRKRQFRSLWIARISAAARLHGMTYSSFMCGLKNSGVRLDRKVVAGLLDSDESAFLALVEIAARATGDNPSAAGSLSAAE